MAKNTQLSDLVANAQADVTTALANDGYVRIYDGAQPATGDTAITTQTMLAELRFGATAFGAATGGVATANALITDESAAATGTASWFRVFASDGSTALWDGSVGTSGANMTVSSTAFQAGAEVSISSFTYTAHKSTAGATY